MGTNTVTTSDIYEATYYFLNGARDFGLEVVEELKKQICKFTLSGENLTRLQQEYFQGVVTVNLFDFRRSYNRVIKSCNQCQKRNQVKTKSLLSRG